MNAAALKQEFELLLGGHLGWQSRPEPEVLPSGVAQIDLLRGCLTEIVGPDSASRFLRFDPAAKTKQWMPSGEIQSAKGNIQPAVVQMTHDHLIAYCRRGGGYDPVTDGYICAKVRKFGGRLYGPDRILHPGVRRGRCP